jgi:hypothetical protein
MILLTNTDAWLTQGVSLISKQWRGFRLNTVKLTPPGLPPVNSAKGGEGVSLSVLLFFYFFFEVNQLHKTLTKPVSHASVIVSLFRASFSEARP